MVPTAASGFLFLSAFFFVGPQQIVAVAHVGLLAGGVAAPFFAVVANALSPLIRPDARVFRHVDDELGFEGGVGGAIGQSPILFEKFHDFFVGHAFEALRKTFAQFSVRDVAFPTVYIAFLITAGAIGVFFTFGQLGTLT